MKKSNIFVATLSFFLLSSSLIGCGGIKLPTTQYEKVKFAFSGVERSFKNVKTSANKKMLLQPYNRASNESALETLFNLYESNDKRGTSIEDLEYNEPPMIQFQYLKKVLEKVGDSYEFDHKYYDTVTGTLYIDMETGYKKEEDDQYKYNYTFELGISINIDENDLINADVSFDIKVNRNNEEYHSKWYVAIELDYDMDNTSPNYTMSMVTENDERDLPYYNHYTYEYDYVDVSNSSIKEWRKFCFDHENRLIKDEAHPTFDSYMDGIYNVDAFSWYKDGNFYKNNSINNEKKKTYASILFNDLGINATDINADSFFNKQGSQNSVIKTCYQEFSKIAKEDIIYSVLTRSERGEQGDNNPKQIKFMNADASGLEGNRSASKNTTIKQLLTNFTDIYGDRVSVRLYYATDNGGLLDEINDIESIATFAYFFSLKEKSDKRVAISLEDTLESAYINLIEFGYIDGTEFSPRNCLITVEDGLLNIEGSIEIIYGDDNLPNIPGGGEESNIKSIAIVGDFNNWELEKGQIEFASNSSNEFALEKQTFNANDKFKIVANHTWDINGGFGYKDIQNIDQYPELFSSSGNEGNILVLKNCSASFLVKVGSNNAISINLIGAAELK